MALPTKEDISLAIERPGAIKATELEGYSPVSGIIGPESYSGGFCIVFPFTKGRDKKAVRIWHQEIGNIQERYKLLSNDIKHCHVKSLIGIEYVEAGLTVEASDIDLTVMEWIEGKSLKDYISSIFTSNSSDTDKKRDIKSLADELECVFKEMHTKGFSHGDLQHENIIITNNGNPLFIDYDCFYTPSMGTSFEQTTSGYNGYQHPSRFTRQYVSNKKTDYFSELILALSIRAIANDFSLWRITEGLDYSLLLTPEDFKDLQASSTCQKIRAAGDVKCNQLLDILDDYLKKDSIDELEPYDVLLDRLNVTFKASKNLIKKGSSAVINWKIADCKDVSITEGDSILSSGKKSGSITVKPVETTEYVLHLSYCGGAESNRTLTIEVQPEAEGTFICDKQFVFPGVPFVLEWSVKNAIKVELNGQAVNHTDKKYFKDGIDKETVFELEITDHFGSRTLKTIVKMLPIPLIKSILLPTPNINLMVNIQVMQPLSVNWSRFDSESLNKVSQEYLVVEPEEIDILKPLPVFVEGPKEMGRTKALTFFNKVLHKVLHKNGKSKN